MYNFFEQVDPSLASKRRLSEPMLLTLVVRACIAFLKLELIDLPSDLPSNFPTFKAYLENPVTLDTKNNKDHQNLVIEIKIVIMTANGVINLAQHDWRRVFHDLEIFCVNYSESLASAPLKLIYPTACHILGNIFRTSPIDMDIPQALHYYCETERLGNMGEKHDVAVALSLLYRHRSEHNISDSEFLKTLGIEAERGSNHAAYLLGEHLKDGEKSAENGELAISYYDFSFMRGHRLSGVRLIDALYYGCGSIRKDRARVEKYKAHAKKLGLDSMPYCKALTPA